MFGAKYSRMKFWIISICLFIPKVSVYILARLREEAGNTDAALFWYAIALLLALILINTLANRIRDYGANPWLSLLFLIPFVNILMVFYYGIVQYGNNKSLKTDNNS